MVIALVLVAVGFLLFRGPEGPDEVAATEAPGPRTRAARPGAEVPALPPLPEVPDTPAVPPLMALGLTVDRLLVACPLPAWFDPADAGALRPAWVEDGTIYELVARGSSQRRIEAPPRLELSYTLEEVRGAVDNPTLAAAILDEAEALGDPKAMTPRLLGALRWDASSDGAHGCVLHPADELVALTVYVEDAEGRAVDAFVKVGESGANSAGGVAVFEVVAGAPVQVSASSAAGSGVASIAPGDGAELVLVLGDDALPPSAGGVEWTAGIAAANERLDADGQAVLAAYRAHLGGGGGDPMLEALAALADVVDRPRPGKDKGEAKKP